MCVELNCKRIHLPSVTLVFSQGGVALSGDKLSGILKKQDAAITESGSVKTAEDNGCIPLTVELNMLCLKTVMNS